MSEFAAQPSTAALAPSTSNIKRLSANIKPNQTSPGKSAAPQGSAAVSGGSVKDVVSPAELCGFVDSLLNQLETRFDDMSEQMLTRMNEMSTRIDNLENAVQDLMHDDIAGTPIISPPFKR